MTKVGNLWVYVQFHLNIMCHIDAGNKSVAGGTRDKTTTKAKVKHPKTIVDKIVASIRQNRAVVLTLNCKNNREKIMSFRAVSRTQVRAFLIVRIDKQRFLIFLKTRSSSIWDQNFTSAMQQASRKHSKRR
jgi:hypothetical protein